MSFRGGYSSFFEDISNFWHFRWGTPKLRHSNPFTSENFSQAWVWDSLGLPALNKIPRGWSKGKNSQHCKDTKTRNRYFSEATSTSDHALGMSIDSPGESASWGKPPLADIPSVLGSRRIPLQISLHEPTSVEREDVNRGSPLSTCRRAGEKFLCKVWLSGAEWGFPLPSQTHG